MELEWITIFGADIHDFYGIINGIDYSVWDPEIDKYLSYNYSLSNLSGKIKNKEFLLNKLSLSIKLDVPLIGMISRFASQKGFDIVKEVLPELIRT